MDFEDVVEQKRRTILETPLLVSTLDRQEGEVWDGNYETGPGWLTIGAYSLISCDLRDISALHHRLVTEGRIDPTMPTLIIAECVFVYMQPEHIDELAAWIARTFSSASPQPTSDKAPPSEPTGETEDDGTGSSLAGSPSRVVGGGLVAVFDMIRPWDEFGSMMVSNIRRGRRVELPGLAACPTLETQKHRWLKQTGFTGAAAADMRAVYEVYLDGPERHRVEALEMMDEVEEWHLLMSHYCITVGVLGTDPGLHRILEEVNAANKRTDPTRGIHA